LANKGKPRRDPTWGQQKPPSAEIVRIAGGVRRWEETCKTFRWLIVGLTVLGVAICVYKTATVVAGTTTLLAVVVHLFASVGISKGLAWLLATLASGYGASQRMLKGKTIKRLEARIVHLETRWDKRRSSSRLTKSGDTHPEDK
jgi:hypothetical protein